MSWYVKQHKGGRQLPVRKEEGKAVEIRKRWSDTTDKGEAPSCMLYARYVKHWEAVVASFTFSGAECANAKFLACIMFTGFSPLNIYYD